MPYALILIGAILLVAGIRNTYADLWKLVESDFTATDTQGSFISWLAVVAVVGGIGYIPKLKSLSIAFMTLLLLVLVISKQGLFAKLQSFIQSGVSSAAQSGTTAASTSTPSNPLGNISTSTLEEAASLVTGGL